MLRRPAPVPVSTGVALFATVVFALNYGAPRTPLALLWIAAPLAPAIPAITAFRLSRHTGLPAAGHRFWRQLALCCALVVLGAALDAADALHGRPSHDIAVPTVIAYCAAVLVLLWSFTQLPLGVTGRREILRIALDGGTVLLAGAVFMWHFQAHPMLRQTGYGATSLFMVTFTVLLEQLTIFAIAKVALAGRALISRGTLRLFTIGLIGGALSSGLQLLIADQPRLNVAQLVIPLVMVWATAGVEHQRNTPPDTPRATPKHPFSHLPYLAIAAVDTLLLVCILTGDPDALPAAVAAVALTGVVVWRQTTAFRENTRLLARLDHSATHDTLTHLPNRALFHDRLAATSTPHSVALIDLDDFKTVNDTLGHAAGDALLIAVAARLTTAVRDTDTVARLGGDEFVVLLHTTTEADTDTAARRMLAALTEPVTVDGHELLVRASIGLATTRDHDQPGDLLRRADIAMYAAKRAGGNAHRDYHTGMAHAVTDTAALGAQLHRALTDRQLLLEYQPIVDLTDGHIHGVEALVRWNHPTRGRIAPTEFIPAAERTGLIVELGDWVLAEACRQLADWGDAAPARLNVNITARQLSDPAFPARVAAVLHETGIPATRLTLEITETVAVELGEAVTALQTLRAMGVRIALDDFGTGQSTLTLLHELPVDQLKLDRSFTQGTASGQRDTMPAAVIALARAVDLDIVAEGVETPEQAARLAALGYHLAQGYLFARPLPAADLILTAAR